MPTDAALVASLARRYTIEREIGRGGMAIVYLATDVRHNRLVAVKVLHPECASTVEARRFLREIAVTADLQHPHIIPLIDSGSANGRPYYVTRYVGGESLRDRLAREAQLPVDEAIRLTCEIAGALHYAHGRGVIHRDVKPGNILLEEGHAVVADFGIARAISRSDSEADTGCGLVHGTPPYMAPEQGTGDRARDIRSDIYSLGCVLYEMLAGEPPFTGPTPSAIFLKHLLTQAPSVSVLRPATPPAVAAAVARALSKAPADRFRTVAEFAAALVVDAPPSARDRRNRWRRHGKAIAMAAAVLAAALALQRLLAEPGRTTNAGRRQLTFAGNIWRAAISPNGQFIAYAAQAETTRHILVQDVAGGQPDTIAELTTPGGMEWSPDGNRLLVGLNGGAVILPRLGGPTRRIGSELGFSYAVLGSWLPDGSRVSLHETHHKRVLVFDLESEDTSSVPVSGTYNWLRAVAWSPNGDRFVVVTEQADPVRWTLRTVAVEGGQMDVIVTDSLALSSPRWSSDGRAVSFARGGAIWRVAVSPRTGRPRGAPQEIESQTEVLPVGNLTETPFSVTSDGRRTVYTRGTRFSNLWIIGDSEPGALPRAFALTSGTSLRWGPVVSPDGRWIGFVERTQGAAELFRMPFGGGVPIQVTSGARVRQGTRIAWSPDGAQIAFQSERAGQAHVSVATVATGHMRPYPRTRISPTTGHLTWAPGSFIAYQRADHGNISLLDPESGSERQLVGTGAPTGFFSPQYAPDGNRLAVWWSRSLKDPGVWVFDLRDSSHVMAAPGMGLNPVGWSSDGRFVYAGVRTIWKIDTRLRLAPEAVLTPPFRESTCTHAGPAGPETFICAAFDFVSDVWMIERPDGN